MNADTLPDSLSEYLSHAILSLRKNAIRASLRRPKAAFFFLRAKRNLKRAAEKRAESVSAEGGIPPFLIASITRQCNLACAGCYARANGECSDTGDCGGSAEEPLDAGRWGELFAEAQALGVSFILLAGGEPMLRRDVLKEAAQCRGLIFPVFTNGTLFDDEALRLFAAHRNLLPILSLEGDALSTDSRRGRGVYQTVHDTMRALGRNGLFFGVSVTVTKKNLTEVTSPEFAADLSTNGCGLVFYVEYVPADGKSTALALGDVERKVLEKRVAELRRSSRMMFISFPGDEKVTGGCLAAGRGFFHINAAGGAEPCPFSPYSDFSLRNASLKDALASPLFRRMRRDDFLLGEHDGGCLLWQKREQVEKLLHDSGRQSK